MSHRSTTTSGFLSRPPQEGTPQEAALLACISSGRLAAYATMAKQYSCRTLDLYLWDHDMACACMGDIAILEIALRNGLDRQLSAIASAQSGTRDWYAAGLRFDDRTQLQLREAWGRLTRQQKQQHAHDHLVAALTFGFWRNLLEDGGAIHARYPDESRADYENDLWRKGLDKAFVGGRLHAKADGRQWTRAYALGIVKTVHALRNRVAHHEALVNGVPLPGENRRISLRQAVLACFDLAHVLDKNLARWLIDNSKMLRVLAANGIVCRGEDERGYPVVNIPERLVYVPRHDTDGTPVLPQDWSDE